MDIRLPKPRIILGETDMFLEVSTGQEIDMHNFNIDESGRKFSKWTEKTVGKGELAHYKQFFLFSLQILVLQTHNFFPAPTLTIFYMESILQKTKIAKMTNFVLDKIENIVGKGENAGN